MLGNVLIDMVNELTCTLNNRNSHTHISGHGESTEWRVHTGSWLRRISLPGRHRLLSSPSQWLSAVRVTVISCSVWLHGCPYIHCVSRHVVGP